MVDARHHRESYVPAQVIGRVEHALGTRVLSVARVGGGCIANACRVETTSGPYFLKWSADDLVARTFPAETAGLQALRAAGSPLHIPKPRLVSAATAEEPGLLLTTWIEAGPMTEAAWERLGSGLAALHRHTAARYGFNVANFIGRLPQRNTWRASWPEFFREERLEPQVQMARANGYWPAAWEAPLARLYVRLPELLPAHPPGSILHGDLWNGNVLADRAGRPALVDPAAYFGHREADLAMTELFGGFGGAFYDAYREAWPLEPGYDARRDVYNLYHLINHLNHFGGGYARSVEAVLRRYGG